MTKINKYENNSLTKDFVRVASVCPPLSLANPLENVINILQLSDEAEGAGAEIVLFPELGVTGYSCADWFYQQQLWQQTEQALAKLVEASLSFSGILVVGAPVCLQDRFYNAGLVISRGELCGVVPKQYLPNRNEYYEPRWFVSGRDITKSKISLLGQKVPFGTDLLFLLQEKNLIFGIEICEDLWAPNPPSTSLCIAGAQLILNLSASNEILGKAAYRRELIRQQSARCLCAYAYSSSGPYESSTDLVFSGHCIITENGHQLAESKRFCFEGTITQADIDLQQIKHERSRNNTFAESSALDFCQVILPKIKNSPKRILCRLVVYVQIQGFRLFLVIKKSGQ